MYDVIDYNDVIKNFTQITEKETYYNVDMQILHNRQ